MGTHSKGYNYTQTQKLKHSFEIALVMFKVSYMMLKGNAFTSFTNNYVLKN